MSVRMQIQKQMTCASRSSRPLIEMRVREGRGFLKPSVRLTEEITEVCYQ